MLAALDPSRAAEVVVKAGVEFVVFPIYAKDRPVAAGLWPFSRLPAAQRRENSCLVVNGSRSDVVRQGRRSEPSPFRGERQNSMIHKLRRLEWRSFAILGAISVSLWVFFTLIPESLAF